MVSDPSQDVTEATTPPPRAGLDFDTDSTRTVAQGWTPDAALPSAAAVAPSTNHIALPVGFSLQEYTLEAVLGVGGFGISYRARDNNLQCQVALKEYLPNDLAVRTAGQTVAPRSAADDDGYRVGLDRFLVEARVLATFRHPNIVRVTRFFEANGTAYMVMDYERGESLREWLPGHEPVDEATLKRMFLPLLDGLAVVHAAGVVHRDIKPANIYVRDADGSLVLLDFGAARHAVGVPSRSLTSIVTPGYAPFEQYHTRGAQGPWTDLYALAGVLYWMVIGKKPLEAPSRIKEDVMMPVSAAAAGRFTPAFLAAIDWGLQVDEDRRPRTVAAFRAALTGEAVVSVPAIAVSAEHPPVPGPASKGVGRISRSWRIVAGVIAVLMLVALLANHTLLNTGGKEVAPPVVAAPVAAPVGQILAPPSSVPAASSAPAGSPASAPVRRPARPVSPVPTEPPADTATKKTAAARPVSQAATIIIEVFPPGEEVVVVVDDKRLGALPGQTEFKLPPGSHRVTLRGNHMPFVHHFFVDLQPDERRKLSATFSGAP